MDGLFYKSVPVHGDQQSNWRDQQITTGGRQSLAAPTVTKARYGRQHMVTAAKVGRACRVWRDLPLCRRRPPKRPAQHCVTTTPLRRVHPLKVGILHCWCVAGYLGALLLSNSSTEKVSAAAAAQLDYISASPFTCEALRSRCSTIERHFCCSFPLCSLWRHMRKTEVAVRGAVNTGRRAVANPLAPPLVRPISTT